MLDIFDRGDKSIRLLEERSSVSKLTADSIPDKSVIFESYK